MRDIHQISQSSKGITTRLTSLDHILYVGLGISLFCIIFTLFCSSAFADYSTTSTASVRVVPTCYMGATVTSAHSATLINGVYSADTTEYGSGIGKTMIRTNCNDSSGYAIYAIGFTGNSYTSDNHTKLVGNLTGSTISTGVYNSSTTNNSLWSMKINSINDSSVSDGVASIENGYSNYSLVPSNFTKVASYNTVTDQSLGNVIETTYAAYIDLNQNADVYTGQVKYVLVHPNSYVAGSYNIAYNANGGTGTMTEETDINNFEGHNLAANGFTAPSGAVFSGWCTTDTDMFSCNDGMIYQPGETVYSLGSANTTVNLYAYWRIANLMQSFQCSSLQSGSSTYLYDERDNNVYLVGKLADNKCWMLDNLRLDPTDSATAANMTAANTNAPANAITNYLSGSATAPQPGWSTAAVISTATDSWPNTYTAPQVNTAFGSNTKDTVVAHTGSGSGKRGTYYNYCAATAGTYCYASGAGVDVAGTIIDAPYDICPANWRMPTGGSSGEYQALCNAVTNKAEGQSCANPETTTAMQLALSLPLSGRLDDSTQYDFGSLGRWWSSTYSHGHGNYMYDLYASSSQVWPTGANDRRNGFSLRCVAK